jgi:DNA mismatch repair protein MSH2
MLLHLDVLASLSDAAATALKPYVRPVLCDEGAGMTLLDQVRHPCLDVLDDMLFFANNVSFKQGKTICECL